MNVRYHVVIDLDDIDQVMLRTLARMRGKRIRHLVSGLVKEELRKSKEEIYKYLYGGLGFEGDHQL